MIERLTRKESPTLQQILEYTDRRTGRQMYFCMHDLVFVNYRTGEPIKNSSYDTHLYKLCEKAGIAPFGMHALRHTYATRAIERGMQPKVLQQLLGHASIRRRWINTSMFLMIQCRTPCVFLRQLIVRKRGKPRKWG